MVEHPFLPLSSALIKLDLSNNVNIVGFGEAFGFPILENLEELDMSGTSVQVIPEDIGRCKRLSVLKLQNTPVQSLPRRLFTDTSVSRIELRGSAMTKAQFLALPGCEEFMKRRKDRLDRDIAAGMANPDTSICGLD